MTLRNGLLWKVSPGYLLDIAKALHEGQTYRAPDGSAVPYSYHLEQVYLRLTDADLPVLVAGAFHDALEDTGITAAALRLLIGVEATEIVIAVTRHKDRETYADYVERVARSGPGAVAVKLADLAANLSNSPTDSQRKRYEAAQSTLLQVADG